MLYGKDVRLMTRRCVAKGVGGGMLNKTVYLLSMRISGGMYQMRKSVTPASPKFVQREWEAKL